MKFLRVSKLSRTETVSRSFRRWVILVISFAAWMLTVDRIPWVPLLLVTLMAAVIVAPEQTVQQAPPDREQSVI